MLYTYALLHKHFSSPDFYQQAVMMSGTDLNYFGFIQPFWRPREYARELARHVGCEQEHSYNLIECLRDNNTVTWERILEAQELVVAKVTAL